MHVLISVVDIRVGGQVACVCAFVPSILGTCLHLSIYALTHREERQHRSLSVLLFINDYTKSNNIDNYVVVVALEYMNHDYYRDIRVRFMVVTFGAKHDLC